MSKPRRARKGPVALVCSSGGHLAHLAALKPWWQARERFWVTFDTDDARSVLEGERIFWCHHPTNRSIRNLVRNLVLAIRVCLRERPSLIVSSGAAVAVPFLYVGKLLGAKTLYLEVVDRVYGPTLTGRLVRPVTDQYVVQWPEQQALYPGAEVIGRLL